MDARSEQQSLASDPLPPQPVTKQDEVFAGLPALPPLTRALECEIRMIRVQEQIDRVQTELDRLEGKLRYLDSRIDLSTITVTLSEKEPVGGAPGHSFVSTLNQAFSGLIEMIDFLIVAFFTLLPLIIIVGIVYAGYRYYPRKKPKEKSPADQPLEKGK